MDLCPPLPCKRSGIINSKVLQSKCLSSKMPVGAPHRQTRAREHSAQAGFSFLCVLQEEGILLCLPGGSDTQGQHRDEGRGQWTERNHHREVCSFCGRQRETERKVTAED